MSFPVEEVRSAFPALRRMVGAFPAVYFDGPGGTQVPRSVAEAMTRSLLEQNANRGGAFATSREADEIFVAARVATASLLGVGDPDEIVFGSNMTSLTYSFSRALSRTWQPGDEIFVTWLDHEANVGPWVRAAEQQGVTVRRCPFNAEDCTLDLEALERLLSERTRLVAVGLASNAVGTINPIRSIAERARRVGALIYVDAVHYAPHGPIDVAELGCDVLVCSAYKFFGPHLGVLWGRRAILESLPCDHLRTVSDRVPERWMTGTQNHEGIAGLVAAVEYLEGLGRRLDPSGSLGSADRRRAILAALEAIRGHERELSLHMLEGLASLSSYQLFGIRDPGRIADRVPTFALRHQAIPARRLAEHLGEQGFFTWDGHFYAIGVTEQLGLEPDGLLRIGFVHYNTTQEIDRLHDALAFVGSAPRTDGRV